MPRSTTASLMASVSVAFSAIRPIQINSLLIALNIGFLLLQDLFPAFGFWFFLFEQDFALHDELKLTAELLLVGGSHNRRAELLDRIEHFRIHVESHEMNRETRLVLLGLLFEARHYGGRLRADGVDAVGDDQDVLVGQGRLQHSAAGGIQSVAQRRRAARRRKVARPGLKGCFIEGAGLDGLANASLVANPY